MNIDPDKHVFYNYDVIKSTLIFFKIKEIKEIKNFDGIYRYVCTFEFEDERLVDVDEEEIYDDNGMSEVIIIPTYEIWKIVVQRKVFFDVFGTPCCDTPGYEQWSSKAIKYDMKQVEFYEKNW